ncbi:MAG: TRAP transporter small permease [Desulfatiglans sp.]|jgi:TRAP-type C4-dicarboxylate transport system permease small subunit|nr:TRAP transporter small permease [Desulfatiglans sp.]
MVKGISNALNRLCEGALVLFLTAMAVIVFLEVLFRYLFLLPLFWTEELARYCLVWASLLGASVALKRGEHIAVSLLVERLPKRVERAVVQAARLSVALILVVILWGGITLVSVTSLQTSPALRIPMAVPYLALPINSGIMLLHIIVALMHPSDEPPGGE